ncbi:hypothetical protein [Shimia sp.]|uniref:hypothetical protein n=1 Tax=Shimia sp. TaxID=1954381 RepID=UPI003297E3D2
MHVGSASVLRRYGIVQGVSQNLLTHTPNVAKVSFCDTLTGRSKYGTVSSAPIE